MPKIKISGQAREQRSGFEPYDGPVPKSRGLYRGVIKKMTFGRNNSGSMGFMIVLELEAAAGDPKGHAQYDGYPLFARNVITETADGTPLKEGSQRNLNNLLAALGTKDDPDMIVGDGDDRVDVKKIGGKNPVGAVVNIDVDVKLYEGEMRPEVSGILPFKETAKKAVVEDDEEDEEDDEDDLLEEDDSDDEPTEDDEASEYDERADELDKMQIKDLKALAKELELPVGGKKDDLIERILDAEFSEDDEEDDEEDEDIDEVDEEEDDDIEEEDDEEAERREELNGFNRVALKKILQKIDPDFSIKKSHSDDDLRDRIIEVEFEDDTPF